MKVFVINLEHEKLRLNSISERLNQLHIPYERIRATYGKDLIAKEKKAIVNLFRWWCAVGRSPTDGEIGCGCSHAKIYKHMIEENIPYACILEDDVNLDDRFPEVLSYVESQIIEAKPQVMLLSNHSDSKGQLGNMHMGYYSPKEQKQIVIQQTLGDFYAECYVINLSAAKGLLKHNFPMITPFDWWGRWRRINILDLYHVFPTVAVQNKNDYLSGTLSDRELSVNKLPWYLYLLHKIKRLLGVTIDRLFTFCG